MYVLYPQHTNPQKFLPRQTRQAGRSARSVRHPRRPREAELEQAQAHGRPAAQCVRGGEDGRCYWEVGARRHCGPR